MRGTFARNIVALHSVAITSAICQGTTSTTGTSVVIADLNGDGKLDLVLGDQTEATFVLGNGDGTFQTEAQFPSGPGYSS